MGLNIFKSPIVFSPNFAIIINFVVNSMNIHLSTHISNYLLRRYGIPESKGSLPIFLIILRKKIEKRFSNTIILSSCSFNIFIL